VHATPLCSRRRSCLTLLSGVGLGLAACSSTLVLPSTGAPHPSPSSTAIAGSATASGPMFGTSSRLLHGGLSLEEHALRRAPELDPLAFFPIRGSQEQVLARHAAQRDRGFPDRLYFEHGDPALWAPWDGDRLVALLLTAEGATPQQTVELLSGDQVLFSTPAGLPSPALPLQGLWTYDGHWALEILLSTPSVWAGEIFLDGDLVNEQLGYDDAFGFQVLSGKPFYFYQRGGHIGLSFDSQEVDLGYSEVPHYQCCSGSVLNPKQAEDMVAFFAERDGAWYYVEVGVFD
jgi:hypothetical protein